MGPFPIGCSLLLALLIAAALDAADLPPPNYDESKVGSYKLPDPLVCNDGSKVADDETWTNKRRSELLELFRSQMHGRSPARPAAMTFEEQSTETALGGLAMRRQVLIRVEPNAPPIHLLVYVPVAAKQPVPAFLGVNFDGNHTVEADPAIALVDHWVWDAKQKQDSLVRPADSTRGASASRWPLEMILKRGYAVATLPRADVEPDYPEGWRHGLRGYYLKMSGKTEFADDDWGAVAAWAWSLSRALDYLETIPEIDTGRVVVHGHSRLGKAALWAGAEDERFAIVVSNNSGEAGAALARRRYGETTEVINARFPHWFNGNFKQYSHAVDRLPFDQHELIALSAPRPVYVASAEADRWADPRGEFLAAQGAEPVYALFGKKGLETAEFPGVDKPVGDTIGYHMRAGEHDINAYDWSRYLDFADRHFKRSATK